MATPIEKVYSIRLAVQGENATTPIEIDMTTWAEEFPNASFYILFKPYNTTDVVPVITEYEDHILRWVPTIVNTAIAGIGYTEVRAIDSDTGLIKKSRIIPTSVENSVSGYDGIEPPSSATDWVNAVLESKNAAENAANTAIAQTGIIDQVILIQDEEPTAEHNKLYIKKTPSEAVEVATEDELTALRTEVQGDLAEIQTDVQGVENDVATLQTDVQGINEDLLEVQQQASEGVKFTSQTLTDAQQAQARANIGAADQGEVTDLKSQLDEKAPAIFVESDDAFSHSDVNIANRITFKGNAYAFKKARYVNAKNYYPKYEYTRTLANNSVSVVCTDGFCIYNGTATGTNGLSGNDVIVSIPAGTYKLFIEILSDNSTVVAKNHTFRFVCSDGTTKSVTVSLGIDDVAVNDVTFTSDVVKFNRTYEVRTNNVYDNYVMWFGLYKLEAVMTDTELTVPSDGEAEYESIIAATDIDTMQHKSIINHITDTKEYVDGHIPSDMLTESDLVYITPEMYGAIGDGVADDTSAVNACITETSRYGDTRNKPVRGYGKYKVTESIRIGGYYLDIFLKSIVYTGDDAALIISGKNSKFEFNEIIATTGTNAVGLRLLCTNDSSVPFAGFDSNLVNVTQRISANGNGMELIREDSATEGFYYNTINVHKIASVSANCMYGDANANFAEIDIYGQAMSAPNGYLYYANRESATGVCLHNMCIEQNVKNGIFRGAALFNCRTAECMNHYTESEPDRGRIFVLEGVKTGELYADEHTNVLLLAVNADNATTYEQMVESVKDYYDETGDRNAWAAIYGYATIEPKVLHLCNGVAESGFGGTTVTRPSGKIIIYYNHVGFVPDNDFYKKITDANYTIELLRTPISARNYYTPTIFDIDVADCQIHLDWSYCCYGINEFRVIQYADKRAKIYDKYGNLMFDGSTHDAGTYVFRCHRTAWEGITFRDGTKMTWVDFSTPYKVYTGSNEEWVIEKLDIVS